MRAPRTPPARRAGRTPSRGWRRGSSARRCCGSTPGRCRRARSRSARVLSAASGSSAIELSVIRRSANTASASVASFSGGAACHQATTGASAASSGRTTDSACSAEPAVHAHDHGLARAEPPADEHLGVEARGRGVELPADDDEDAAGVRLGGVGRGLLGLGHPALVGDDDQRQRDAGEHRTAGAPLRGQFLHDGRAGGVPERRHGRLLGRGGGAAGRAHGRRHRRPSAASISSAARGPHSPAR